MIQTSPEAGSRLQPTGLLARWRRDSRGVTAIEFAMVAMPFLSLLFGIIGVGLYFFTTFTLENAVEQAARLMRTGQAQEAGFTEAQFKAKVCEYVPSHVDCTGKVRVNVLSFPDTTNITPGSLPNCLNGDNTLSGATQYDPGGPSQVVVVWACYEWELSSKIPFLDLGNMAGGSRLIQATSVFRSEPYGT
ncbi:MAG: TadE/TadG family type IV pilus assembly protein [Hyphomicrobiaceae bacterium]